MLNKIITGISQSLDNEFNENEEYEIYIDSIKQDLNEPCFFIFALGPSGKQLVGNRYDRKYSFDIHYFPKDENSNTEINDVTERLFQCCEYITVDGSLVKGKNMNFQTVNGVLHFFVNFNMIVRKDIPKEDLMETLAINQRLKR